MLNNVTLNSVYFPYISESILSMLSELLSNSFALTGLYLVIWEPPQEKVMPFLVCMGGFSFF